MHAGHDLDKAVHQTVMGKSLTDPMPPYSIMIDAAFAVVEFLRDKGEGMAMTFGVHPTRTTEICMWDEYGNEVFTTAETTPLAICLAALKHVHAIT